MHLLLTDLLICPRCATEHGLVLLAERLSERRVLEGWLGCPVCRERYPVRRGFADLRVEAHGLPEKPAPAPGTPDEAFRLAALLGIHAGPAFALMAGRAAFLAPRIAALVEQLEVVAAAAELAGWDEQPGVSRIAAGDRLPFFSRRLHAVALADAAATSLLEEGARVLAPPGRLVLDGAPADAELRLARAGLRPILRQDELVVAERA